VTLAHEALNYTLGVRSTNKALSTLATTVAELAAGKGDYSRQFGRGFKCPLGQIKYLGRIFGNREMVTVLCERLVRLKSIPIICCAKSHFCGNCRVSTLIKSR